MRLRLLLLTLLIPLAACVTIPDSYAPPIQRKPLDSIEPSAAKAFLRMGDASAANYIVGDISEGIESGSWRWTKRKPTMRFFLKKVSNQKFRADLSIADETFKETGPVTITFTVNDHELARETYAKSGRHPFEKAVPAEWLHAVGDNIVSLEIDKLWTSPADGVELGFILASAGFLE
jgi:hypothetical protein